MTSSGSDWRERLAAAIKTQFDTPQARMAMAVFQQAARAAIHRAVQTGASNLLIRAVATPSIRAAYAQLLYRMGIPYQEPTAAFISKLIEDLIAEARTER